MGNRRLAWSLTLMIILQLVAVACGSTPAPTTPEPAACESFPCQNGLCLEGSPGYQCLCDTGYTGDNCETNIDDCASSPCLHGSSCEDGVDEYLCLCTKEWQGPECAEDVDECSAVTGPACQNEGVCINEEGSFRCECAPGWEGATCDIDPDDCAQSPCQNGGSCTDFTGGHSCECPNNWTGDDCQIDVDECAESPCQNGGQCVNVDGRFRCECLPGYSGPLCEVEINECLSSPCEHGGNCTDEIASYSCACSGNWTGDNCEQDVDECSFMEAVCLNDGACTNFDGGYNCTCTQGFNGPKCENNIDDCESSPCQNAGACFDGVASFVCECEEGFNGSACEKNIDDCASSPCQHNTDCTDGVASYSCDCGTSGYEGVTCETDINDCFSLPCVQGTCFDELGGFKCECMPGYEGEVCDIDTDDCASSPCLNGATCNDFEGEPGYSCRCLEGFIGDACEENVDDCLSSPCAHGACQDGVNAYDCDCAGTGYNGTLCEADIDECRTEGICQPGYFCTNEDGSYTCEDIDECEPFPCANGQCWNKVNEPYECLCYDGWTGDLCDIDIDDCESSPCQNSGTCSDAGNQAYACNCTEDWEGDNCERLSDDCNSSPCLNGATCVDGKEDFLCYCAGGYEGGLCEFQQESCWSSPCINGGNCTNEADFTYACSCPFGYAGENCQSALAPVLKSANMSSTAVELVLTFDRATSRFGQPVNDVGRLVCENVLSATTVGKLGDNAECYWRDNRVFVASLTTGFTIEPGATVGVKAGLTGATANSLSAGALSTVVRAPSPPIMVIANVAGPTFIGDCHTLRLKGDQSSGGYGKPLTYTWVLQDPTNLTEPLQTFLQGESGAIVDIESALVPQSTTIRIKLFVTNWFGSSNFTYHSTTKSAGPLPTVSINDAGVAGVRTVRSEQELFVATTASKPQVDCSGDMSPAAIAAAAAADADTALSYEWSCPTLSIPANTVFRPSLSLLANTLTAGATYDFTVTVTASSRSNPSTPALNNSASLQIQVEASALRASIAGGNRLATISTNSSRTFKLDASASRDPEFAGSALNDSSLVFSWTCELAQSGRPCFSVFDELTYLHGRVLQIPHLLLNATAALDGYRFSLVVSKDARKASASAVVDFTYEEVPDVGIAQSPATEKHPAQERLILTTVVADETAVGVALAYRYQWTCLSGNLDLEAAQAAGRLAVPSTSGPMLAFRTNTLTPGFQYEFEVAVWLGNSLVPPSNAGRAVAVVSVNAPPTNANCFSNPAEGEGAVTSFEFRCEGVDDEDDPIKYRFSLIEPSTVQPVGLTTLQYSNFAFVRLPPNGRSSNRTVRAQVQDKFGASAYVDFEVLVHEPEAEQADEAIDEAITDALESGDSDSFTQAFLSAGSRLNSETEARPGETDEEATERKAAKREDLLNKLQTLSTDLPGTVESANQALALVEVVTGGAPEQLTAGARVNASALVTQLAVSAISIGGYDEETATSAVATFSNLVVAGRLSNEEAAAQNTSTAAEQELQKEQTRAVAEQFNFLLDALGTQATRNSLPFEEVALTAGNLTLVAVKLPAESAGGSSIGVPGASFALPEGFGSEIDDGASGSTDSDSCSSISLSFVKQTADVYSGLLDSGIQAASGVVALSVFSACGNRSKLEVEGLSSPMRITIDHPEPTLEAGEQLEFNCAFFDEDTGDFSTEGCYRDPILSTNTSSVCVCDHLTDFNVQYRNFVPTVNTLGADDFKRLTWSNIMANPVPLITVLCIYAMYFMMVPVVSRWDRARLAMPDLPILTKKDMSVPDVVRHLVKVQRERDRILAKAKEEEAEELRKCNEGPRCHRLLHSIRFGLLRRHAWIGVFKRKRTSNYTGLERLTALLCTIFGVLLTAALFFGNDDLMFGDTIIGVISSIVVLPLRLFVVILFLRSRKKRIPKELEDIYASTRNLNIAAAYSDSDDEEANGIGTESTGAEPTKPSVSRGWGRLKGRVKAGDVVEETAVSAIAPSPADHGASSEAPRVRTLMWGSESAGGRRKLSVEAPEQEDVVAFEVLPTPKKLPPLPPPPTPPTYPRPIGDEDEDLIQPVTSREVNKRLVSSSREASGSRSDLDSFDHEKSHPFSPPSTTQGGTSPGKSPPKQTSPRMSRGIRMLGKLVSSHVEEEDEGDDLTKKERFTLPHWFKTVGWVMATIWCLASSLCIVVYALKFDAEEELEEGELSVSSRWLMSTGLAFVQDVFMNEPMVITIKAISIVLTAGLCESCCAVCDLVSDA